MKRLRAFLLFIDGIVSAAVIRVNDPNNGCGGDYRWDASPSQGNPQH